MKHACVAITATSITDAFAFGVGTVTVRILNGFPCRVYWEQLNRYGIHVDKVSLDSSSAEKAAGSLLERSGKRRIIPCN
jgi:hypothetical protein